MKRIKIAIIILLAVLVAAGGIFLVSYNVKKQADKEAQEKENKLNMIEFNNDDATKVEITNESGHYTAEYISGEGWQLTDNSEFELNDSAISSITSNMSNLKAENILNDKDKSKYGFDNPTKITCYANDTPYTIIIGDPTPTYENYYAMKENDDTIYLISYASGIIFDANKDSLKQTYIYRYNSYDIDHFAVWNGKQTDENIRFSMSKDSNDNWAMDKPISDSAVNYVQIDEFLTDSAKDQIYSFVEENCTEADYSKYGFDNPKYVFEISAGDKSKTVIFGAEKADNELYGLFVESGQVVTFMMNELSMFNYHTLDMIETNIFSADIESVNDVVVTIDGKEVTLNLSGGESEYKVNDVNISEKGDEAKAAFVKFYNAFNNASYEAEALNATPSGDIKISVKYSSQDGIVTEIAYIPVPDSDKYYAMKNGEYTGFTVEAAIIESISSTYETLMQTIE